MVRRRKVVFYSANGFESWRRKKSRDTLSLRCCLGAIYHFNNQKLFFFLLNIVLYCQQSLIKLIYIFFNLLLGRDKIQSNLAGSVVVFFPGFLWFYFRGRFCGECLQKTRCRHNNHVCLGAEYYFYTIFRAG